MRILVTGHKGYIGAVMVPMLRDVGHDVTGLDSDIFRGCTFISGLQEIPELQIDIRDVKPQDLQGFEAVVHLAALSNDPLSNLKPEIANEINFAASVRLAQLAKDAGVSRFLFSSSCAIYGKADADLLDETAEIAPVTPYNISKLRVEQELTKLASDRFSPTFMRNATAYGVSPRHNFELVLNNLVAWAHTTGRVFIKSDGSPWRPIVHIEDISRAFLAVLSAPRSVVHNQSFNVGRNDENYAIRELAEIVQQVVPGSHVEYAKDGGPDPRSYRVDFTKIQRLVPDFKPQWNGRRGVEQLYAAYVREAVALKDIEGPRFKRLDHLKGLIASGRVDSTFRWRAERTVGRLRSHTSTRQVHPQRLRLGRGRSARRGIPGVRVAIPAPRGGGVVPLNVGLVSSLADEIRPDCRAVVIKAGLGLRVGKLLGLGVADVDFMRPPCPSPVRCYPGVAADRQFGGLGVCRC